MTRLELEIGKQYGKTVVENCYFTAPLKLGTPKTEDDGLKAVLMMASAGLLSGDQFDYDIVCGEQTCTEITEQSFSKIFDTQDGKAVKKTHISVGQDALLYYHPCPVIPFHNSCFEGDTRIEIATDATLLYSEVTAMGRIAMGERFAFRSFHNRLEVRLDGDPVYLEFNQLQPGKQDLEGFFYFDGYTHQGSMYCYFPEESMKEKMLEVIPKAVCEYCERYRLAEDEVMYGISEAKAGIILKILGKQAQDLEEIFYRIYVVYREFIQTPLPGIYPL